MSTQQIEHADVEALAAILENEKKNHCRTRTLCFGLFLFCTAMLVIAIGDILLQIAMGKMDDLVAGNGLGALQILTSLSAVVIALFTIWYTTHNCINSIERTLYAARAGRHRLFASFLGNLQCADKKKKTMWAEMLASMVT